MNATYKSDYVSVKTDGSVRRNRKKQKASCCTVVLAVCLVMCLLVICALVGVLVYTNYTEGSSAMVGSANTAAQQSEVCNTKACVKAASHILGSIDPQVDPCEDFYMYSCGGWRDQVLVPEHMSGYTMFTQLSQQVDLQIKNILDKPADGDEHFTFKNAQNFYLACKDDEILTSRGDQHFKDFLGSEFGGWPMVTENWDEDAFDVTDAITAARRLGDGSLVVVIMSINSKNSSEYVLLIDQPNLGLPNQKYYQVPRNDTMLMAYQDFILTLAQKLGGSSDPAVLEAEVAAMVDFEIELANLHVPAEERRDNNKLYNPMTLAEVQANYSSDTGIDFERYVTSLLTHPDVGVTDFTSDEVIINRSPRYYQSLGQLLQKTPKRTIANYIVGKLVKMYGGYLSSDYRDIRQNYRKLLYGQKREQRRDISCSRFASETMAMAVGREYVKENFDKASKEEALAMIVHLKKSFDEVIDDTTWMDESTQTVAKEKNDYIFPRIGYSDNIFNDSILEEKFRNYTFLPDKYFENVLLKNRESQNQSFRKLRLPIKKDEWFTTPQTVNAFYSPSMNEIQFPAGILQAPFFHKDNPKSINYGAIGTIIGHEITHGFDDRGRQYDKNGNVVQWWSNNSIANFKNHAQCLINQYGNFTIEKLGMNLNGIRTQGENIADNGGVGASFRAYKNWVKQQGKEEPTLPGLNLTNDQLFFMAFAQVWCAVDEKEGLLLRLRTGAHSPGQFRVMGTAQNSPEFAQAFSCPKGSPMNPHDKCGVWGGSSDASSIH